jgi:hypothetical protein
MQCFLYKIYFWKGFSYILQIDMHLICAPMLTKFYSCKMWVLHWDAKEWDFCAWSEDDESLTDGEDLQFLLDGELEDEDDDDDVS